MPRILAADCGGTNCRFAVFEARDGRLSMGESLWLPTAEAVSFSHLLRTLRESDFPLRPEDADVVALAVAGPVRGGVFCDPPNIPWNVDLTNARERFGFGRHVLINDFAAQAYAVRTPAMDDAVDVLPGKADPGGPVAVLGPGTGLGLSVLVPDGRGGWGALPTEAGHAMFPFMSYREFAFQSFLRGRTGLSQVTGDMVVSGSGLSAIHAFHTEEEVAPAEAVAAFDDNPVVLEWAARFLGRMCRESVLRYLATGGVVVSGGVAAKARTIISHPAFAEEFRKFETFADRLGTLPVRLNVCENAGLWGAAFAGMQASANNAS